MSTFVMRAMVTVDGVAIQESAVCDRHWSDPQVVEEARNMGANADDIGEDHDFHDFDETYVQNNDLHCIGCGWERGSEPTTYRVRTGHGTVHQLTSGRTHMLRGLARTNRPDEVCGKADCGALTSSAAQLTDEAVTCGKCEPRQQGQETP